MFIYLYVSCYLCIVVSGRVVIFNCISKLYNQQIILKCNLVYILTYVNYQFLITEYTNIIIGTHEIHWYFCIHLDCQKYLKRTRFTHIYEELGSMKNVQTDFFYKLTMFSLKIFEKQKIVIFSKMSNIIIFLEKFQMP